MTDNPNFMNQINKSPLEKLGYDFIEAQYLPKGSDEYWLRDQQNPDAGPYRALSRAERLTLTGNRNKSDNWDHVLVTDGFSPELVTNCHFFGLVRIGKLDPLYLEFHNLRCPVGLYNSTIISSDLGDHVAIDNVDYLSHYIVGSEVMIVNVNELATTGHAKFGNGILKQGEPESQRIWLELRNENGGRRIMPFDGMTPGDAFLWSSFRHDKILPKKLKAFTENKFDQWRGHYGSIGDRSVIKNCRIIKDCLIGSDAYLKGANKLKNLTINSSEGSSTQIGEGCELVNGIIGHGCRIFYGAKAVRFVMAPCSQLKYGARLINSYLGDNSAISCCEVLNALIFPAHEQHHNNSFLCAALLMGQSNVAAGATIGSNHNSRSADGELVAGRGFWPGLCTSLKHHSRFASFILLAKADYPFELNIPIPFSLVSNDAGKDELVVMPGYWLMHNMYALARNASKHIDRDKRTDKIQLIEYDFLAPDSVGEMVAAIRLMEKYGAPKKDEIEIPGGVFENSKRRTRLIKASRAHQLFREMILYYGASQLVDFLEKNPGTALPPAQGLSEWVNVGGQLIRREAFKKLVRDIRGGKIRDWDGVHAFYQEQADNYPLDKLRHALAALLEVHGIDPQKKDPARLKKLLQQSVWARAWMASAVEASRKKDHDNPFRKMAYENAAEMNAVLGKLTANHFIKEEKKGLIAYRDRVNDLIKKLKLDKPLFARSGKAAARPFQK